MNWIPLNTFFRGFFYYFRRFRNRWRFRAGSRWTVSTGKWRKIKRTEVLGCVFRWRLYELPLSKFSLLRWPVSYWFRPLKRGYFPPLFSRTKLATQLVMYYGSNTIMARLRVVCKQFANFLFQDRLTETLFFLRVLIKLWLARTLLTTIKGASTLNVNVMIFIRFSTILSILTILLRI